MMRNPGKPATIYEIAELVAIAHTKAMTPSNIINSFAATGIFPFDRNRFNDDDFLSSSVTDRSDPTAGSNNQESVNINHNGVLGKI